MADDWEGRVAASLQVRPSYPNQYAQELAEVRRKYLRDWSVVKRTRFNAAKRYERKNTASSLGFAIAGVAGFVLPYFTVLFENDLSEHSKHVFELGGQITGLLGLCLGLVEQARDYSSLHRRFDECGRNVNTQLRALRNRVAVDQPELDHIVAEYQRALDSCGINHDDIDREIAIAEDSADHFRAEIRKKPTQKDLQAHLTKADKKLRALKRREVIQIYWLYWTILIAPLTLSFLVWWALKPPSG